LGEDEDEVSFEESGAGSEGEGGLRQEEGTSEGFIFQDKLILSQEVYRKRQRHLEEVRVSPFGGGSSSAFSSQEETS
jgi:hypothetical protein